MVQVLTIMAMDVTNLKGENKMVRVEFLYDGVKDVTAVYIWRGQLLIATRNVNGKITAEDKRNVKEQMNKEFK